jgi:hypothetical protein
MFMFKATATVPWELEAVSKASSIMANNVPPWAIPKMFSIS